MIGGKPSKTLAFGAAVKEWKSSSEAYHDFLRENSKVMEEFERLQSEEKAARAKAEFEGKKALGKRRAITVDGVTLTRKVRRSRQVDSTGLLSRKPALAAVQGLFKTDLKKFDSVVASGVLTSEDVEELIDQKETERFEISYE